MLAVGGRGALQRLREVARRRVRRVSGDTSGKPRRDLLEQPAVAVRIIERSEGAIAAILGIRAADPEPAKQVGLVRARVHDAGVVEHFTDLDAATEKLVADGLDVRNDQVQPLGGAGRRGGDVLAKDDRAPGARRRELNHPEVVTDGEVG